MSFQDVMQRLERIERFLESVIVKLEHGHSSPPSASHCGVSIGGAAHRPQPIYDEQAYFISSHNPR